MRDLSNIPAPRWSVVAPVKLLAAPKGPSWRTVNISATGMFVSGPMLLDAGSEVEVAVVLPAESPFEIRGRVEVVWARNPLHATANLPAGMGLRFVGLAAPMERALKAYLDDLAAHQSFKNFRPPVVNVQPSSVIEDSAVSASKAPTVEVAVPSRTAARPPSPPVPPAAVTPPQPPFELPREINPGDTLGRYTIIQRLGAGGMGDVFLAEHTALGRRVALKRLQEQHVHDRLALRRFYDEARLVNQIHHDNIVQITDLVVGDADVFIVMELLVGPTLAEEIDRGPLSLLRTAVIGLQLCDALDAVHRAEIVHRDLKPGNIMLVNRHGNPDTVKLLDFGIAKLRETPLDGAGKPSGQVVGTPGFMAPEQLLGKPVDTRADIYSLGVVLFVMVTGRMPFVATSAMEMMLCQVKETPAAPSAVLGKPLPAVLDAIILRCLARDPKNRPLVAEIMAALTGPSSLSTGP